MNNIKYIAFMQSYYQAAQGLPDAERLAFYEAILAYSFDNKEPQLDNQLLNSLFTLVKPTIDNSIKTAIRNQRNATKNKENNMSGGLSGGSCHSSVKEKEKEKEKEMEKEMEMEKEKEKETTSKPLYHDVLEFLSNNSLQLTPAEDITELLSNNKFDTDYLNYVLDVVKQKYPNHSKRQLSAMFNKAYKWENLLNTYTPSNKIEVIKLEDPAAPTTCSECGAALLSLGWGSRICPSCREKGNIICWELSQGKWQKQA